MYIITEKKNEYIVDILRANYHEMTFTHKYECFEDIFENGTVISDDSISYDKSNGIQIHRKRNIVLILTDKKGLTSEYIEKLRNDFNDYFHIYVEDISELKDLISKGETNTFAFRNYLDEILCDYKNINYLMIHL